MKLTFINKSDSPRLLLIFTGWSTDETAFTDISCPGYDIAVASDYREIEPLDINYDEVVVMAWSLGVHAAEIAARNLPLTLTMAINGTPSPVSDTQGIPIAIFRTTAEQLSESSLAKFRRRMGAPSLPRGNRSIESLRDELLNFPTEAIEFRWDRAIISDADRIFPPVNQLSAWTGRAEITEISGPHTPDFQALINRFIINKSLVSSRFTKGRKTYEEAADVQHRIADHLFSLWQKHGLKSARSVLEIGVGNGYFTSLYSPKLKQAELTLWDIAPENPQTIAADAEIELPRLTERFDAIASASTMQWFNSPSRFLRACADTLNSGGFAVLSTFGPETFRELTLCGVVPLPYLSEDSLRRIIPSEFETLELHSGLITKVFGEPIDVIRHLQATGVNARPSTRPLREIIKEYPRLADGRCPLTYQPIYMILKRK